MSRRLAVFLTVLGAFAWAPAAHAMPPIKHVWTIVLENKSYDQAFVNNTNPYLWKTLPAAGNLARQYHGTGHFSLGNYITMLSGQPENLMTQTDCQLYSNLLGTVGSDGIAIGSGCVYPPQVKTLVDQLEGAGYSWKGYMEDMGKSPDREPTTCGNPPLDKQDPTQGATANDQYAARHNPFVYFHSILDAGDRCAKHVGPLEPLVDDLKSVATTPNYSFITPNLCNDGHDATPCAGPNAKGTNEGGLIAADAFLAKWVPLIMASPAYKQDGLILVTLDESGDGTADACCNEPNGPNTPLPGQTGPGGGRIGTVLLSPYIKPGSTTDVPYNHYSYLLSMEHLFGISEHLGYASIPGLVPFGDDVFTNPSGTTSMMPGQMQPGDAGSMGKAVPLKLKFQALKPFPRRARLPRARVILTGSDRLVDPVRLKLIRGKTVIGSSGVAKTLRNGRAVIRTALYRGVKIKAGRYKLRVEVLFDGHIVKRKTLTVRIR